MFILGVISPSGEFRLCNHSNKSYGNILSQPINKIWHSKSINDEYRSSKWITEPCLSCEKVKKCMGGCRIDSCGEMRVDPLVKSFSNCSI